MLRVIYLRSNTFFYVAAEFDRHNISEKLNSTWSPLAHGNKTGFNMLPVKYLNDNTSFLMWQVNVIDIRLLQSSSQPGHPQLRGI